MQITCFSWAGLRPGPTDHVGDAGTDDTSRFAQDVKFSQDPLKYAEIGPDGQVMPSQTDARLSPSTGRKKSFSALVLAVLALGSMVWLPMAAHGDNGLDSSFGPTRNLWIDRDALRSRPTSGAAWQHLADDAQGDWGTANVSDQNSEHDVLTLAGALYAVRQNDVAMRGRVISSIEGAIGTEQGGRTLALGRNLTAYVLAADVIGYDSEPFRNWISSVRNETLDGRTLVQTHEERANNWGTHAGAARIATDLFLGDTADLSRAAQVFLGFLGDTSAYTGFNFGSDEWQADPSNPVPINRAGATKNGINVDGALVDDVRRCDCPVQSPAPHENYQWEAMQGVVTQATLLNAAGYTDIWQRSDAAIGRAARFLYEQANFPASGDDSFVLFLLDAGLGTSYSAGQKANTGKGMSYTDFTHPSGSTASTRSTTIAAPTPRATATMKYVSVQPARLFDTRTSDAPSGKMQPGQTLDIQVTGKAGIPSSKVGAVVLNVTATNPSEPGFVTVWPAGDSRPTTSSLNVTFPGETVPNLVTVPVGKDGKVSFYSLKSLDLLADVAGYFVEAGDATGGRYVPLAPGRVFDTRGGAGPAGAIGDDSTISIQIAGQNAIPSSGVSVAVLNLTAISVSGPSFLTVFPHGTDRPLASNVNLVSAGDVRSNLVFAPVGADGSIDIYALGGVQLVGDVLGYFTDDSAAKSTSGMFVATNSVRHVDTRIGAPTADARWNAPGSVASYQIGGDTNVPAGALAVLANLTVTQTQGPGFFTIWGSGTERPATSNLNVTSKDATRSNAVIAALGTGGAVSVYSHNGSHTIMDVFGYFAG